MCNAWNHPANCDCGWGAGGYSNGLAINSIEGIIRRPENESFTVPNARCPVCKQNVFFYQSVNGGRVYFDELGPPWPKHYCTDVQRSASGYPKWKRSGWKPAFVSTYERGKIRISILTKKDKKRSLALNLIKEEPTNWAKYWNGDPMFYRANDDESLITTIIIVNNELIEVFLYAFSE